MSRKLAITLSGIVSIIFTVAVTVLAILLASFLTPQAQKVSTLSVAAVIVQCLSLCMTTALLFLHVQRRGRNGSIVSQPRRQMCLTFTSITVTFLAATAIGFTLGWTYNRLETFHGLIVGTDPRNFMLIIIVVYGLAILAQVLFLVCLLWVRDPTSHQLPALVQPKPEVPIMQEEEASRPATATTVQSNPFREVNFSRPASAPPSEGPSTRRSSLSIVTRQNTSKTKLIGQSSVPRYSRSSSFDNSTTARPSQDSEGFDSWDTSTVAPHIRETVNHSSPLLKKQGLEPIPGSRSPSPAKALEGPFFTSTSPEASPPPSPLPQPSYSRPPSRQRAPSSEDHIHPLFRTCSPTPPPTASSGTVVLAAPVAGALVNERILRRMRSGSLPSSPSPLNRSESYFEFRTAPTSPAGETPPIPNFIIEAGERGSMDAYQGRRAASVRLPGVDR
ncbi:MAG: hypothetical protein HETSPECPRED_000395 [Heterodermia speciosa]|uniref:Uncharacterized protein n=1 Tax=Heterodermia speciosa TaxID=116794 RepID=A0A8H3EWJ1_9LECA|nr:MAG: hypothetical protein HETSPECPRED_000395 [Heterodermia speciosa]